MADIGRPTVMTQETLNKLDEAFSNGATDKEAIFYAGISQQTFYVYVKEHPEYNERIDALRDMIKYQARKNVIRAIKEEDKPLADTEKSQWYLERKAKDEFSQRTETTGKDGKDLHTMVTDEDIALAKIINEQRRNTRTNTESQGTDAISMDGEVQD